MWSSASSGRPRFKAARQLAQLRDERVEDRALDVDALGAEADLAAVGEERAHRPSIAVSRSASAKTSAGFLPPSSIEHGLDAVGGGGDDGARRCAVSPVKVMRVDAGMRGQELAGRLGARSRARRCRRRAARRPRSSPRRAASRSSGVSSDGLTTTVLPQASAGPTFQVISSSGRFHGEITATTPLG